MAGIWTFLFTDIEGSTAVLRTLGHDRYATLLSRHQQVIRQAVEGHDGTIDHTDGDANFAILPTPAAAAAAAIEAQLVLGRQPAEWDVDPVRVRMGIHTGEAELLDAGWVGVAIHEAARIASAAYGGQILLSSAAAAMAESHLPPGASLEDLGRFRLKDVPGPVALYQLNHPDLAVAPGSVRASATARTNLPPALTTFIGRREEVSRTAALLEDHRIVTLTGVGGVGKTRLAAEVATQVIERYPDGVWLVELAPIANPGAVDETVASALGIQPRPNQPIPTLLCEFLEGKTALLVLDNCEHLVDRVATLVEKLVKSSASLGVLATSREGLSIGGEYVLPVQPLRLPKLDSVDAVAAADATQLFVARAREAGNDLTVDESTAPVVTRLCQRLDGIPLAIELAAARTRSMALADIVSHLDDRFRLLTGGRRTAMSRQQTLRGAIDWSYDLLSEAEKTLLRRIGVFAGTFDLRAVEAVGSGDGLEMLEVSDLLDRLIDKSLVVAETATETARFRLLETMRDYAWERLTASGELSAVAARHAHYYAALAAEAGAGLRGPDEVRWLHIVTREIENLRAGVAWAIAEGQGALALEAIAALSVFEHPAGTPFGLAALEAADLPEAQGHPLQPMALASAAWVTLQNAGDLARALDLARRALETAHELPAGQCEPARCRAFSVLCTVLAYRGEYEEAAGYAAQWLDDARAVAFELTEALTMRAGVLPWCPPESHVAPEEIARIAREAVDAAHATGNPSKIAFALMVLASAMMPLDAKVAMQSIDDAVSAARSADNDHAMVATLNIAMGLHLSLSDYATAAQMALTGAEHANHAGSRFELDMLLLSTAACLAAAGSDEPASLLQAWVQRRWPEPAFADVRAREEIEGLQARLDPAVRRRHAAAVSGFSVDDVLDLARGAVGELRTEGR